MVFQLKIKIKKMNVLSLFDGMSCGQIALERAGIKVDNYFASEIDKFAIKITQKNYPNTRQLGDVKNVSAKDLPKIDLLIGGSPCQNLSIASINQVKHNGGLEGEKSSLFYEYLRLLLETNPKYFLLENVSSMNEKDYHIISDAIGVRPVRINSDLVSAQDRSRYYWTNIPLVTRLDDKGIVLSDIVLSSKEVPKKYWYDKDFTYNGDKERVQATLDINTYEMNKRVYNLNGKSATLVCCRGGYRQKKVFQDGRCRNLTPLEYERLQTVPDNYTESVSDRQRYNLLGNGWTVDVIAHIFKNIKN